MCVFCGVLEDSNQMIGRFCGSCVYISALIRVRHCESLLCTRPFDANKSECARKAGRATGSGLLTRVMCFSERCTHTSRSPLADG